MRKRIKTFKALTLVEVVTYLAIFAFIFISIIEFVISVKQTNDTALDRSNIERALIFVMSHINDSFDQSNTIVVNESVFNSDNGILRLNSPTLILEYTLSNGQVRFRDNGVYYGVSDPEINVDKLYFEQVLNRSDEIVGVRVTIKMRGDHQLERELTSVFLLR